MEKIFVEQFDASGFNMHFQKQRPSVFTKGVVRADSKDLKLFFSKMPGA
jgi:hypothetical protein